MPLKDCVDIDGKENGIKDCEDDPQNTSRKARNDAMHIIRSNILKYCKELDEKIIEATTIIDCVKIARLAEKEELDKTFSVVPGMGIYLINSVANKTHADALSVINYPPF